MNATSRDLAILTEQAERRAAAERAAAPDPYRLSFHLMPPTGWLNDPNGLCQANGVFHAYYQYAPFNVDGGIKLWGHAVSRDLLAWDYRPAALFPDHPFDVNGVYSGSALVEDGRITVFYTGNVKREDDDGYDYVTSGREAAVVRAESADGDLLRRKRVLLTNADYPADDTLHVRDPKVWRLSGAAADEAAERGAGPYLMVLGARRRGDLPESQDHGGDAGEVLVYASADARAWRLVNRVSTRERFGYMWECPDYFELPAGGAGAQAKLLSVSPQGLTGAPYDALNVYQSGYFPVTGDIAGACELGEFCLWDWGFDFYAPQSFLSEGGRRILIGWMGIPDEPAYGNDPTVARGWQHALTVPREVSVGADGRVRTLPVHELLAWRTAEQRADGVFSVDGAAARLFDLEVTAGEADLPGEKDSSDAAAASRPGLESFLALIADELELRYDAESGVFAMRFADTARTGVGCGRAERAVPVARLESVRVVADASSVEVFLNDGAAALTTRYYPKRHALNVEAPRAAIRFWPLNAPAQ